jgi:ATP-dependent RNA helicase SUPV3L1/SUV3
VLGHGVNLPCDRILFAETQKFDGLRHRQLENFEIGQIAGRAGRYGFSDVGEVGVLSGIDFLQPDAASIGSGLEMPIEIEGFSAFRRIESMVEGPTLSDLGCRIASEIPDALRRWYKQARLSPRAGIEVEMPTVMIDRLEFVDQILKRRSSGLDALTLADAWRLARCRLSITNSADCAVLEIVAAALDDDVPLPTPQPDAFVGGESLEGLEYEARRVDALQWCALAFPQLRLDSAVLERFEEILAEQFATFLRDLTPYTERLCEECSNPCPPIFRFCSRCAERRRRRWAEAKTRRRPREKPGV